MVAKQVVATLVAGAAFVSADVSNYIDPFIGTRNGGLSSLRNITFHPFINVLCTGHVFPGATLPYGMAKAVADSTGDNQGGFSLDSGQGNNNMIINISFIRF